MKCRFWSVLLFASLVPATQSVSAAPDIASANAELDHPAGVTVARGESGFHFADARGMTLYALNQRIARSRGGGKLPYCVGPCTAVWTELSAPADAKPVGDWTVLPGTAGPQWVYRGNPVFLFKADKAPSDVGGDQYEDLWTAIAYISPAPKLAAPATVMPLYSKGDYILADGNGRALFVAASTMACAGECGWQPLVAGMAARAVGDWAVARDGPEVHWTYRGKPVFVSQDDQATVPGGAQVLRP